jgi:hypothetical protein
MMTISYLNYHIDLLIIDIIGLKQHLIIKLYIQIIKTLGMIGVKLVLDIPQNGIVKMIRFGIVLNHHLSQMLKINYN